MTYVVKQKLLRLHYLLSRYVLILAVLGRLLLARKIQLLFCILAPLCTKRQTGN